MRHLRLRVCACVGPGLKSHELPICGLQLRFSLTGLRGRDGAVPARGGGRDPDLIPLRGAARAHNSHLLHGWWHHGWRWATRPNRIGRGWGLC